MKFFSIDSPFMVFMNKVANMIILNLLTIFCCLPIFTAGAAITALYYVTLKMARGEDPYIIRNYFKSFAQNFKQATIIWLMILVVGVALFFDWKILASMALTGTAERVLKGILIAVILVLVVETIYVFPVLSRFDNTIKVTIRNALLMAVASLPRTVLILLIHLVPAGMILASDSMTPVVLLVGIPLVAYLCSMNYIKIFKPFEPAEEVVVSDEYELPPFMMEEMEAETAAAGEISENAEAAQAVTDGNDGN